MAVRFEDNRMNLEIEVLKLKQQEIRLGCFEAALRTASINCGCSTTMSADTVTPKAQFEEIMKNAKELFGWVKGE